ncbi:hypothetical protein AB4Z29_31795 [Paenibacillus sp. 2TAB23]|uniref:hypothetical protein n=1 Tax=Paenibacillus sp. 2TAB23 TaxID=3233004 RepID=UPI003F97C2B7
MKRKMMLILTGILVLGLLSACGTTKENDHSGHNVTNQNHENSASPSAGHGEHGDHDTKEQPADSLKASFSFVSGTVIANGKSDLDIQISDSDGNTVNEFELNHEKLMHLIVVSKDLSYFNHIHPEYDSNGKFAIETSFPNGGEYKVFSDFIPKGGASTTLSEWVKVEGEEKAQELIEADAKLVKVVDGKEVELTLSSTKANDEITLTFNILDAQTKKEISDLEQYLGAVGHVVILSDDAEQYLHVHPMHEKATGPKAEFMTSFPKSGTYKIWGQFQHQGEVFTVPFVVDIK